MRLERWRACRRPSLPQRETRSFRLRRGVARRAVYVAVSRRRHRSVRQDTPLQVRSCSKQGLAKRRGFAIYLHALPPAARPCRELPRCAPRRSPEARQQEFPRQVRRAAPPRRRPRGRKFDRLRSAARPRAIRTRRAPRAHTRPRLAGCPLSSAPRCRSSLQALSKLGKSASDPALHRAERHAGSLGELVIGEAAHEGSLDRQGLAFFDLIETGLEPLLLLGRGEELERRDSGVRHIRRRFDRLATACERTPSPTAYCAGSRE